MRLAFIPRPLSASLPARLGCLRRRSYLLGPVLGLAACLGALPFVAGLLPIVHFVRERIDIAVYPEEVRVEGLYVYRNPWPFPVLQGLSIPLPVDAAHPMPTELTAARLAPDAGTVSLRSILGHDSFELRFHAHEEVHVIVRYRQYAPTKDARYLLTTTRPWRRPLEHAVYTLTPHGVALTGSNSLFDRTRKVPSLSSGSPSCHRTIGGSLGRNIRDEHNTHCCLGVRFDPPANRECDSVASFVS